MPDTPTLHAGTARADITDHAAGPVNDPLYAKALVLRQDALAVALVTLNAVAIGEIGRVSNDFLPALRARLQAELGLDPTHLLVTASHCHGVIDAASLEDRVVQAVREAWASTVPVRAGAGRGHEDRISENRRLRLLDGREGDVRHAYALAADEAITGVGPIDPEIGILRLDREDGRPLAVLFNFAVHPIQGVPSGANTADLSGFACSAIEDVLGEGVMAFFVQGCAGDVNPVLYKDTSHPRDSEPLGERLGLSTLKALRGIECSDGALALQHQRLLLPRADLAPFIAALGVEQTRLVDRLSGTTLNLKGFLRLSAQHGLAPEYPSYDAHRYLHDHALGRSDFAHLDAENRARLDAYRTNVEVMEQLTRLHANLGLLRMHQAQHEAAGFAPLEAELVGLRVGEFVLIAFPGELSVQIGLDAKARSPHPFTFFAGYTNGYLYYTPTAEQLVNRGWAQEDSDSLVAPEWRAVFDEAVDRMLEELGG